MDERTDEEPVAGEIEVRTEWGRCGWRAQIKTVLEKRWRIRLYGNRRKVLPELLIS